MIRVRNAAVYFPKIFGFLKKDKNVAFLFIFKIFFRKIWLRRKSDLFLAGLRREQNLLATIFR